MILFLSVVLVIVSLILLFRKTRENFMLNGQVLVYQEGDGDIILDLNNIGTSKEETPSPSPSPGSVTTMMPTTTKQPVPVLPRTTPPPFIFYTATPSTTAITVTPSKAPATTRKKEQLPTLLPAYLFLAKNKMVYMGDQQISIRGINWAGLNYGAGIDSLNTGTISDHITILKDNKINAVRLPMSANLMLNMDNMLLDNVSESINPGVKGTSTGLHVDKLIRSLASAGILVMLNMHRFTGKGNNEEDIGPLWYSQEYPEEKVIQAWVSVAQRYKEFPNVFAMDIKNEPHSATGLVATWGGNDPKQDWASACERIGNAILKVNPNVLICVAGVTDQMWGDSVAGALERPIKLDIDNKVIYSPHFYIHWNYPNKQGFDVNTYLDRVVGKLTDTDATIVIGEYGFDQSKEDQVRWINDLVAYFNKKGLTNAFYWALNENEGVGAGLLQRGTLSVIQKKLDFIKKVTPQPSRLIFP